MSQQTFDLTTLDGRIKFQQYCKDEKSVEDKKSSTFDVTDLNGQIKFDQYCKKQQDKKEVVPEQDEDDYTYLLIR